MPELYYKDALKLAQKEVRARVARGEHPYLLQLDDILSPDRISKGASLGTKWIPSELIIGTRNAARANAFARNFMPLLDERSEFASKWQALCEAHIEEGIRDSILCYEYMNRYYVEEGNKRVSVLKFFGAPTVYARVIRIMPEQNGSKEVELYNAFLEFNRCSGMHLPEFSRPQSYQKLQRLLGKEPEEVWSDDERKDFTAAYHYFREAYAPSGNQADVSVGDALLVYIEVYGYQNLRGKSIGEIKKSVAKLKEEISLDREDDPIEIKLHPQDMVEKSGGLLSKVLPKTPLKVAFIHDKTPITSGWTLAHEEGRHHVERVFGDEVETSVYYNVLDDGDPLDEIEKAIADGNSVIFTTSPRLLSSSLRAAVEHQKVTVLNCSLNTSHRYIRTYYARMYEVKFIIGAIAGALAQSSDVGYICDYPIFGQVAGINAFALGVQMVNPLVKVRLEWSSVGGTEAAVRRLREKGVRLISTQDSKSLLDNSGASLGLAIIDDNGQTQLARPVWKWGVYYEEMIRAIRDGSFKTDYEISSRALNYYWGLSAGVIGLECFDVLPESVRRLAGLLQDSICRGVDPFCGPLFRQDGRQIIDEKQALSLEQIISMDWLVESVIGAIPKYDELDETGKATADVVGVEPSTKEKQSQQDGKG